MKLSKYALGMPHSCFFSWPVFVCVGEAQAHENGEACHAGTNAGRFVRDGWDGDWLSHPNNRRCNHTELTEKGRPVITAIPHPANIKRCAARLVAGNVNWTSARHCWYAPNQRGGRKSVQLWVGIKCASLSQIRRECGVDSDATHI